MGRGLRSWSYGTEIFLIRLCYALLLRYSACVDPRLISKRLLDDSVHKNRHRNSLSFRSMIWTRGPLRAAGCSVWILAFCPSVLLHATCIEWITTCVFALSRGRDEPLVTTHKRQKPRQVASARGLWISAGGRREGFLVQDRRVARRLTRIVSNYSGIFTAV